MLKLRGTSRELSFSVFALPLKIGTAATHLATSQLEKIHNHCCNIHSVENSQPTFKKSCPFKTTFTLEKSHNQIHVARRAS